MTVCANCGTSLDGYRPQARHCGGPCRAAASRARAAQTPPVVSPTVTAISGEETAQKRTQQATEPVIWDALPRAEQERIGKLLARHADRREAT